MGERGPSWSPIPTVVEASVPEQSMKLEWMGESGKSKRERACVELWEEGRIAVV